MGGKKCENADMDCCCCCCRWSGIRDGLKTGIGDWEGAGEDKKFNGLKAGFGDELVIESLFDKSVGNWCGVGCFKFELGTAKTEDGP